jgi:RNA polymerase sigma factor for flagellar operon FliA
MPATLPSLPRRRPTDARSRTPAIREVPREAWAQYKRNPTTAGRNAICEAYLPLVRAIALRLQSRLPGVIDPEDLISAGCFGLIDAIDAYDPDRSVTFSTFAGKRIFGAAVDYLRGQDWPTRTIRIREQCLRRATEDFTKAYGREPSAEELIGALPGSRDEAHRTIRDGRVARIASLSADRPRDGRTGRLADAIADRRSCPGPVAADADARAFILRQLSRAERLLVVLYYAEQMTMREIGQVLGLSESRISQMRALIVAKLRSQLAGRAEDLAR